MSKLSLKIDTGRKEQSVSSNENSYCTSRRRRRQSSRVANVASLIFSLFSLFIYKNSASKTKFRRFVHSSASLDAECHRGLDGSIYPAIKKRKLSRQFVHHFCFCYNIPFPLFPSPPLHKFLLLFISMPLTLSTLQFIVIHSFTWQCRYQLFMNVSQFSIQSFSPATG